MRRTAALQDVRQVMFRGVFDRYASSELNQIEAAELLGISERTFRRWCVRFGEGGEDGLLDRRLGKASGKRVPVDPAAEVEGLYRTRYGGFTARRLHVSMPVEIFSRRSHYEHLVHDHGFSWCSTWIRSFLQSKGLLVRAPKRDAQAAAAPAAGDDAESEVIASVVRQ